MTKVLPNGTVVKTITLGITINPVNLYPSLREIEGNLYLFYQNGQGVGVVSALAQDLNSHTERPIGDGRNMTHPTVAYDPVFQSFGLLYYNGLQGQSFFQKLKF